MKTLIFQKQMHLRIFFLNYNMSNVAIKIPSLSYSKHTHYTSYQFWVYIPIMWITKPLMLNPFVGFPYYHTSQYFQNAF